jgi:hypothetical protein
MKTLKSVMAGILLMIVYASANAAIKPVASRLTKEDVVNIYIDAIAHNDMKGLDGILDDGLQYNIQRGADVRTLHKSDLMDYLQSNPADPSVTTKTTIVESGDMHSVVRIDFKYAAYTRSDLLTLDDQGGWVITKVESSFS